MQLCALHFFQLKILIWWYSFLFCFKACYWFGSSFTAVSSYYVRYWFFSFLFFPIKQELSFKSKNSFLFGSWLHDDPANNFIRNLAKWKSPVSLAWIWFLTDTSGPCTTGKSIYRFLNFKRKRTLSFNRESNVLRQFLRLR